ncbi:MAG: hypothetical protein ACSHX7_03300 [Luteolibacter sp.]
MITYSRDSTQQIPSSAVKIVGLGGAGANMLERVALDSIEGAELLALNTDIRTLSSCLAKEKVQLGVNLTKGLGTGGDPELGQQAMLEAEKEVREALKGQQIVFLCTGLGGGTGSGAAPIVARIAREEGAFVVVFATMPFFFEGRRRREQAETSLNELAVLSNALVTFDNNRMGELVLAKQGIHEAFSAADKMISESIKAVIRLVIRPGLINVGLDDLMSALRTTRSRCLFGSGMAAGKDRASKALRNALCSPLLDQGSLLKEAQTVLVHLSGGESLTLFEIELLMQNLQKHVPEKSHVLFGAAIDPAMGDNLSITLISALPEDALTGGGRDSISSSPKSIEIPDKEEEEKEAGNVIENPFTKIDKAKVETEPEPEIPDPFLDDAPDEEPAQEKTSIPEPKTGKSVIINPALPLAGIAAEEASEEITETSVEQSEGPETEEPPVSASEEKEERPFAEPDLKNTSDTEQEPEIPASEENDDTFESSDSILSVSPSPRTRPAGKPLWGKTSENEKPEKVELDDPFEDNLPEPEEAPEKENRKSPSLQLDGKASGSQSELSFDNTPRGRFEGENPNVVDGEDLDLPPFLRKKKS